jgi:hypothetical protein
MRNARVQELTVEMAESYESRSSFPLCRIYDPKVATLLAGGNTHGDYSFIVDFSPEAAQCFVNTLNGDPDSWDWPGDGDTLMLDGLCEVSPAVASFLGGYDRGALTLDGLTSLSDDAARGLSNLGHGILSLDGLTEVSPQALRFLLGTRLGVHLNGIEILHPEHAEALADAPTGLSKDWLREWELWELQLNGVRFMPDVTAAALVRCAKGMKKASRLCYEKRKNDESTTVTLKGLTALDSPVLARAIGRQLVEVSPKTIQWISPRAAAELGHSSSAHLPQLRRLTLAVARSLAEGSASVSLPSYSNLSPEIAKALGCKRGGELLLDGLTSLSAEIAEGLAQAPVSRLSLNGITSLDVATAEKLATSQARLIELRRLQSIEESVAEPLSAFSGEFKLDSLMSDGHLPSVLRRATANVLRKHRGSVAIRGVEELTADAASELSLHGGTEMLLDDLKVLPAFVAEKLVPYVGKLSLCGLTKISDETAAQLVDYQGWALILRGLISPSREQVSLLSRNPRIKLPGSDHRKT